MPGMEYRLEPVPGIDEGGRLYVRGPNVMAGYLRAEKPGVLEPLEDGWHDTGDIVTIDEDGFVTIRGRAKRFAKIGGEMISLAAVEALAGELWKGSLSAVATVPDARKGEKLILLTEAADATRAEFLAFAKANGAMDMMVPAEVRVVQSAGARLRQARLRRRDQNGARRRSHEDQGRLIGISVKAKGRRTTPACLFMRPCSCDDQLHRQPRPFRHRSGNAGAQHIDQPPLRRDDEMPAANVGTFRMIGDRRHRPGRKPQPRQVEPEPVEGAA